MTITLPDSLARLVAQRATQLGYDTPDAYVADLLRQEVETGGPERLTPASPDELDRMLAEGMQGEPMVVDEIFWENQRRQLAERRAARNAQEKP